MDQKRRNRFGEEFHLQRFLHHFSRVNYEDWAPSVSRHVSNSKFQPKKHLKLVSSPVSSAWRSGCPRGEANVFEWQRYRMLRWPRRRMLFRSHTLQDKNCMLNRVVMKSRYRWGPDCCTLFLLLDYAEVSARSACFQFHVDQIHFGLGYSAWSSVYPVYTKHTKCIFERS